MSLDPMAPIPSEYAIHNIEWPRDEPLWLERRAAVTLAVPQDLASCIPAEADQRTAQLRLCRCILLLLTLRERLRQGLPKIGLSA